MPNTVMFITFRLAEGVAVPAFLALSEKLHREFMSKQKGYLSWQQLQDGATWADVLTWECAEDIEAVEAASMTHPLAQEFYACLNMESVQTQLFTVQKSYERGR